MKDASCQVNGVVAVSVGRGLFGACGHHGGDNRCLYSGECEHRVEGTPSPDEVRAARNVAEHLAALGGPDLRHLSDDELVAHVKRTAKVLADGFSRTGVSAAEAAGSFARLAGTLRGAPEEKLNG